MGVHARSRFGRESPTPRAVSDTRTRTLGAGDVVAVAREFVGAGLEVTMTARGQSMLPTIRSGDRVLLAPHEGRLRLGDVVLTGKCGKPVLHRVVRLEGTVVVTRGDSRPEVDSPVVRGDVIAVALFAEGAGRRVALRFARRFGARAVLAGAYYRCRARTKLLRERF